MLDQKKQKEWYQWGKEYYQSTIRNIRTNKRIYDSNEKIEQELDNAVKEHYNFKDSGKRLKEQFNYTDEDVAQAYIMLVNGYKASRDWYRKADEKMQIVLDKYMPIFKKAEEIANNVDVSDISDGFPCGSAHLYLDRYPEGEELRKAIAHFQTGGYSSDPYKYQLPIKIPSYGQCISYDERICGEVRDFLRGYGILTNIHTAID